MVAFTCPRCGKNDFTSAGVCWFCGYQLTPADRTVQAGPAPAPAAPQHLHTFGRDGAAAIAHASRQSGSPIADFFRFRLLISPLMIRILYPLVAAIGSLAILLVNILGLFPGAPEIFIAFISIIGVVVFNLLWRLQCELLMQRFSTQDQLKKILEKHES